MRVTNNMITSNTKNNINANKILVDQYNTQMTTQNRINKPSENPVIAIRSLRMQTSLTHIDQYLNNNIKDADSWLEVTDTALMNMVDILTNVRTLCIDASTGTKTADDRNTILKQLRSLSEQIYAEGNADFSGRTVFTGYRTTEQLTFKTDEEDTTYTINQDFDYKSLTEQRYYYGNTEVPADVDANTKDCDTAIGYETYQRIRLAYGDIGTIGNRPDTTTGVVPDEILIDGQPVAVKSYDNAEEWEAALAKQAADPTAQGVDPFGDNGKVVFIKETGELVFKNDYANTLKENKSTIQVAYDKTGFTAGEPRPEYYYNCAMKTPDMKEAVEYTKENQEINFEISSGIMLPANTQASDVLGTDIGRDMSEMIDIVNQAISAHDKVDEIKKMMSMSQYADDDSQKKLQTYLDAANKEATYADDNLQKTYKQYISNFDGYLEKVNIAHTNVGSLQQRVALTKTRVENQQETVEELKTNNDKRDISDIIIDYYAAYNAYTSSLTAASKVGSQTLLNYL